MYNNRELKFVIPNLIFIIMILLTGYLFYIEVLKLVEGTSEGNLLIAIFTILIVYITAGAITITTCYNKEKLFFLYPTLIEYFTRSFKHILLGFFTILFFNLIFGTSIVYFSTNESLYSSMLYSLLPTIALFLGISEFNTGAIGARIGTSSSTHSKIFRALYLGGSFNKPVITGDIKKDKEAVILKHLESKQK